ncbi:MAG TPA: sulfotransferase [Actinomycetota bacterium]
MKVVYIAGSGRSGSTIVDNILGQLDGWVSVGEVRFLWERGIAEDRRCGCGEAFSACPFWQAVLARAFPDGVDPARMRALLDRGTRARRIPALLGRSRRRRFVRGELTELSTALGALYGAIADVSGARVIVDSSKLPTYGAVLGEVPGVDLRAVHLVRDPRAAAYSWLRTKDLPDRPGMQMQRQRPVHSAALWTLWNTMAEVFWGRDPRGVRVRYEDFAGEPRAAIARLVTAAEEPPDDGPFVSDAEVELTPAHGVAGNPSRFTTGRVQLRPDDAWRTKMRRADRWTVSAVTWPLLLRHGYAGRR